MIPHLAIATEAAREAGAMLKKKFGLAATIERKPDRSLVSNLDREAERIIIDCLHAALPDYAIIGEESGGDPGSASYTWVIDPLDGTHNYLRNIPVYGVSIGLMRGSEFIAGVIYMPAEGDLYAAEQGGGAWKNGKRIRVSDLSSLEESSLAYDSGFRSGSREKILLMEKFASRVFNIRMSGSSARNLTFLAEGTIDMVIEFDDRLWDFAAAITLIREAGGLITDHAGGPVCGDRSCYCASNSLLHGAAMKLLSGKL